MDNNKNNSSLDGTVDYGYNFGNYSPEQLGVEETINAVFIIDKSGSVFKYVDELNNAWNEFITRMQKSHHANKIMVSVIEFNHNVDVVHGFRPISELKPIDMRPRIDGTTALYNAVETGLKNALDYRKDLENSGVNCKTLLFVITDGDDNQSGGPPAAAKVKDLIQELLQEERNFMSFESILFGVGEEAKFEEAQQLMGIKHLAKVGTSADDIRKMIGMISQSITSASAGQNISIQF